MIKKKKKIIRIGSSDGITLSKKDLATLGAKRGDIVKVRVELSKPKHHDQLMNEYDSFVEKYGQTLKNLADR